MTKYSNNSGETIEDAIVITQVANHSAGVQAEYNYIIKKHGQARLGWTMRGQALMHKNGRAYDCLEIILADGSPRTYYFDITAFFKQLGDEMMLPQPNLLQQIFAAIRRFFGG